jgi:hypothetical protein
MEKMEKIEKIEKANNKRQKAQKQKEEKVKNEYYRSRKGSQQKIEIMTQGSTRFSVQNGQIPLSKIKTNNSVFDGGDIKNRDRSNEKGIKMKGRFSVKPMAEGEQLLLTQNEGRDRLKPIWGWVENLDQNELSEVLNQLTKCRYK